MSNGRDIGAEDRLAAVTELKVCNSQQLTKPQMCSCFLPAEMDQEV